MLWGHIHAAEYRKVIVGLIFLRYISSAFEKRYNELVADGDGFENEPVAYLMDNIFFVPEKSRWSIVSATAHTPEIGSVIDDAMRAIEDENKTLKNVLPKNYASPDLDKRVLGDVVDLFTNMGMTDTSDNKDLLGRTYEYCIAQFAAYEGVKGGEFYTPSSIVKTIVSILNPFENCRVYDPCCGSGGMFVQSAKFIQAHSGNRGNISVYGQGSNADTWKMAKMNIAIRGIDADFGACMVLVETKRRSRNAKLYCVGRDIENAEINVHFDSDLKKWIVTDEPTAPKSKDNIFLSAVYLFIKEKIHFEGTATELVGQLKTVIDEKFFSNRVTRDLVQNGYEMRKYGIDFKHKRTHSGRIICLDYHAERDGSDSKNGREVTVTKQLAEVS